MALVSAHAESGLYLEQGSLGFYERASCTHAVSSDSREILEGVPGHDSHDCRRALKEASRVDGSLILMHAKSFCAVPISECIRGA